MCTRTRDGCPTPAARAFPSTGPRPIHTGPEPARIRGPAAAADADAGRSTEACPGVGQVARSGDHRAVPDCAGLEALARTDAAGTEREVDTCPPGPPAADAGMAGALSAAATSMATMADPTDLTRIERWYIDSPELNGMGGYPTRPQP